MYQRPLPQQAQKQVELISAANKAHLKVSLFFAWVLGCSRIVEKPTSTNNGVLRGLCLTVRRP
jgi:hypothetical protein